MHDRLRIRYPRSPGTGFRTSLGPAAGLREQKWLTSNMAAGVRMGEGKYFLPVAAPLVEAPRQFHVLLRHGLIRQPYGCDGLGSIRELLEASDPAFLQRQNMGQLHVDGKSAPCSMA